MLLLLTKNDTTWLIIQPHVNKCRHLDFRGKISLKSHNCNALSFFINVYRGNNLFIYIILRYLPRFLFPDSCVPDFQFRKRVYKQAGAIDCINCLGDLASLFFKPAQPSVPSFWRCIQCHQVQELDLLTMSFTELTLR